MALYYHRLLIFLAGYSLFVLRVNSQAVCPNNWIYLGGSCYKISSDRLNWNAAKAACKAMGSDLVMLKSQAELQALGAKISQGIWIGLYRDPKDTSRWLWVDGTRATYTNWQSGEPNNFRGTFEGCGEMHPGSYNLKWNDGLCSNVHQYVCETTAKCTKLTLGSGVRVSPSHCLSSNQGTGSTCSFSCARGYRLSGPSSTQCRKGGTWSRNVNSVSCNVVTCPALTVSGPVKSSPNGCTKTQMRFGTKCSFSCSQRYQLQGPSYKQCETAGKWTDSAKTVTCVVVKCPALNVSRLVKISPTSCVTSPMKINTNCSFSCPQGYQLQGPLYRQCGSRGQWTNSAKKVSCIDIDECSVSNNGGCSHKCVNTVGDYKCECLDPELSLSTDNKTCQAPGVDVQCNNKNMTIIIPKSLLRGIDRDHLRLLDTTCKATETSAYFFLTTPLTGCDTTSRHTPTAIVYSNAVLEIPVAAKDVVTRVREIEIPFSCFYPKYGMVSSVGWKPSNRKLVFSDEGKGNFTLALNMFPDKRFVSPYKMNDFPVAVVLRKLLFFEVSVTSSDKQLSIIADQCYATPTQNQNNLLKYEFITKGCPNDVTVKYHSAPSVSAQRFSLEAFKFIADHPYVFVHCHVIVCNATDPGSKCAKKCYSSGRGRREIRDHMTDDVYSLAQGPLHLAREKREQKSNSDVGENGSSPSLMMVLFLMCVACLAGTALMAIKKSRNKPGYTVLATGDEE